MIYSMWNKLLELFASQIIIIIIIQKRVCGALDKLQQQEEKNPLKCYGKIISFNDVIRSQNGVIQNISLTRVIR